MKKYFHKITAMLLAAVMAVPMVSPVAAYTDDGISMVDLQDGTSSLKLGTATVRKSQNNEYAFGYADGTVEVKDVASEYKMLVVELPGGGMIDLPDNVTGFNASSTDTIKNTDNYILITMEDGVDADAVENYIEGIMFTVPANSNAHKVNLLLSTSSFNNAGYYEGHFYQYVSMGNFIFWEDANEKASAEETTTFMRRRGYLATANTPTEMDIIQQIAGSKSAWLGGKYLEGNKEYTNKNGVKIKSDEAGFYWVTGPECNVEKDDLCFFIGTDSTGTPQNDMNYWGEGEPSHPATEEPYLQIRTDGKWNDMPERDGYTPSTENHPKGYIAEYGGLQDILVFERDDTYFGTTGTLQAFTVNFELNSGTMPEGAEAQDDEQIIAAGAVATEPTAVPVKAGATFAGWYTDSSFENEWNASEAVTNNMTIYAKWTANPLVNYDENGIDDGGIKTKTFDPETMITIKSDGGTGSYTYNNESYSYDAAAETSVTLQAAGDVVTLDNPTKTGYTFAGWTYADNTFTAQWEADVIGGSSDGIPDKYQMEVTFEVVGGTWDKTGNASAIIEVVTLEDGGKWSASGSAEVELPAPGTPANGYKTDGSHWEDSNQGTVSGNSVLVSSTNNTFTFYFTSVNKQMVYYHSTERNADNSLQKAAVASEGVVFNSKVQLIPDPADPAQNRTYVVEESEGDQLIPDPVKDGYIFMGWEQTTPTDSSCQYALKATWGKDEIDADKDTAGEEGDGIPDSYQAAVTFKVVGGYFDNHDDADEYIDYVTLTVNGVWDEDGTAEVEVPDDMENKSGYRSTGSWDEDALNEEGVEEVEVDGNETFTYTFRKKSSNNNNNNNNKNEDDDTQKEDTKDQNGSSNKAEEGFVLGIFSEMHVAYIFGYEDGLVRPEGYITRAEVASILYNLLSVEMQEQYRTTENNFSDVPEDKWYSTAISTLAAMELLKGYEDGTFAPNENITRAELAVIMARFESDAELKVVELNDIEGYWAEDQILLAAFRGWISGYPDGSFRPANNITRAETAAMINRMMQRNPRTVDDLHADLKYWPDNSNPEEWYYIHIQEATKDHEFARDAEGFETRAY